MLRLAPVDADVPKGTSLIRTPPPPWDHHRALGIGVMQDSVGRQFLMSEESLHTPVPGKLLDRKPSTVKLKP